MAKAAIARIEATSIDEAFGEFAAEAAQVKDKTLAILRADLPCFADFFSENVGNFNRQILRQPFLALLQASGNNTQRALMRLNLKGLVITCCLF